jgi:3-methyladenine DNA glycosylase AlkC
LAAAYPVIATVSNKSLRVRNVLKQLRNTNPEILAQLVERFHVDARGRLLIKQRNRVPV